MAFETNWLRWPFERKNRTFRVYVVEPIKYEPKEHGAIFNATITNLIAPTPQELLSSDNPTNVKKAADPDLIVFPEAFLSSDDLILMLQKLTQLDQFGCLHIGLRPNYSEQRHLFQVAEINELILRLKKIPSLFEADLENFSSWLERQQVGDNFNLACMFTLDPDKKIRVCLHPKLVRSKFEFSALYDEHMIEANLLSLVTLEPRNRKFMTVTVQPMICSDGLLLPTDAVRAGPLEAFTDSATNFPEMTPDHIDIVSLSLCTPLQKLDHRGGGTYRQWHSEFRKTFVRAAEEDACPRHHFATFVMANFGSIPDVPVAGMSGAFMPIPLPEMQHPESISLSSYGTESRTSDPTWVNAMNTSDHAASHGCPPKVHEIGRGYLACLDVPATNKENCATILGFTITRMVRDNPRLGPVQGLTRFEIRSVANP
ncbi:hypothetical protein [Microvirgula aerodenitrificans]|uniref:hypothetical protein n=1 Tax=Microvirgula aerodenitrificans TaxID=57480 RepID=UPI00248D93BD|nr:hypothetical protein [Microvirgula aerodenitrificans]